MAGCLSFFHANVNSLLAHGDQGDRLSHLYNRISLQNHDIISLTKLNYLITLTTLKSISMAFGYSVKTITGMEEVLPVT